MWSSVVLYTLYLAYTYIFITRAGCEPRGREIYFIYFSNPSDRLVHMVTEVCLRLDRCIRRTSQGWECTSCESGTFENRELAENHARQHQTGQSRICPVCSINFKGKKPTILVKHVKDNHQDYISNLGI